MSEMYGLTIDELIKKLLKKKAKYGNVEVTLLQVSDEDESGDVTYWNAHICNLEKKKNKDREIIVSIY